MRYTVETTYPYEFHKCSTLKEARKIKKELRKQGKVANIVCENENGNDYIVV